MAGYFGNPYYHKTTRRMVTTFGNLFNDLQLIRYNKAGTIELERITVPIVYAPKEKFLLRISQDPELTRSIQVYLPRISFNLEGLAYDSTRKQVSTIRNLTVKGPGQAYGQYMGVPYNFNFSLSVYARNVEDGLQIIEQILPVFRPDFTVSVELDDSMNTVRDVPIILQSVTQDVQFEGAGEEMRVITWNMEFMMKGYLYGPTSDANVILSANTNMLNGGINGISSGGSVDPVKNITVLVMQPSGFGAYKENELVYQDDANSYFTGTATGEILNWDDVNRKVYLANTTGTFTVNSGIVGVTSGAHWNIANYYISNVPFATVNVKPSPNTAFPPQDYGFTTTITEG